MTRLGVVYLVVFALLRITLAAPEACGDASPVALRAAARRAADWVAVNQRPDGSFLYLSKRDGTDLGSYNDVRHAGVVLALYRSGATTAADRGLEWALARLRSVRRGGVALASDSVADTGGAALLVNALIERRARTGEHRYDAIAQDLGEFLVSMQRADGGFYVAIDVTTSSVDRETTSPYYPGEALWALARLASVFPSRRWERPARRAAMFIATRRDHVEHVISPPLNDHWASYGFAEMATWSTLDPDVASYARLLFGRFALLIRSQSARDSAPIPIVHGPARRSAALGTWVEGQAALARLATRDRRVADLDDRISASARCGAALLVDRQDPNGAWYIKGETRMDDEQHAISGLMATADLLG